MYIHCTGAGQQKCTEDCLQTCAIGKASMELLVLVLLVIFNVLSLSQEGCPIKTQLNLTTTSISHTQPLCKEYVLKCNAIF